MRRGSKCINESHPAFFQANCFHLLYVCVNHKAAGKTQEFGTNEKTPFEASVSFENKPPLCLDNGPLTTVNFT